jgi:hypothetical protein
MFCREFSGWLLIPLTLHLEVAVYWMTRYNIWRQTVKIWSRTVPYNVLKRWNMKSPVALNMRLIQVLGCLRHLRCPHDVFFYLAPAPELLPAASPASGSNVAAPEELGEGWTSVATTRGNWRSGCSTGGSYGIIYR